ncbi:MAG: hypothetical protein D6735_02500 [Acidobacteria bacterium]|nr:MAG: hypothetical protein D6735_02500 [Acidobacteriota bacterium]
MDPKQGEAVSIPSSLRQLLPGKASSFCEVIFLGSCSDASIKQLLAYLKYHLSTGNTQKMVLVVKCEPRKLLKTWGKDLPANLKIYHDKEGTLHSDWNAFFTPRRYMIAHDGTLINLQRYPPLTAMEGGCDCEKTVAH